MAREMTDDLTSLVKKVDEKLQADDKLRAFVVINSDQSDSLEDSIKETAKKNSLKKIPITLFESASGPPKYKLHKDAQVTVMMWVGGKVKVNHAFRSGEFNSNSIDKVLEDIPKLLEKNDEKKPETKKKAAA